MRGLDYMLLLLVSAEAIVCCKVASFRGCDEHKETYNSELCSLLTTKCELRCPRREEPMSLGTPIPNVLHQMWKTTALPGAFHYTVSTMLRTHPHWHYVFWTDEDLPGLFVAHAEKVGINFNKFGLTGIQTSDVARYLIMFVYGGFYADLDMESLRPLDALLGSSIVLGREPDAHAYFLYNGRQRLTCNAILGSKPTEGFWLVVLLNLKAVRSTNAVGTTGPLRLDEIVSEFGYDRYVLNASFFYPLMGPFAKEKMRHYCMMFAKRSDVPASKKATNNSSSSSRVVNLGKLGFVDRARMESMCSQVGTGRRKVLRNVIRNDSFTAHHWSHTNLNPECLKARDAFELRLMLTSGRWYADGDPEKRPRQKDPRNYDQRLGCGIS